MIMLAPQKVGDFMTDKNSTYIVYAKRTALGKLCGAFASTPAPLLAASLIKDALKTKGLISEKIDEIIMGNVLSAGIGQAPARQAAIYGGLPLSVCATTVNKVCASGLKAVMFADQAIRLGDSHLVIAGGMENMTLAPHLLPGIRTGVKFGGFQTIDHLQYDGLTNPYDQTAMGVSGELCATEYGFSREAQDLFAKKSYEKSRQATEKGWFKNEILGIEVKAGKSMMTLDKDEEPFSVDLEKLSSLRPAFSKDGTITAGNASSINDGAAILILASGAKVDELGLKPLARIVSQSSFAQEPKWFTTAPIEAIRSATKKANLKLDQLDFLEINEAFSVVTMAAIKALNLDEEKVNVHGGAVSLGHPIGASGARILTTLIHSLHTHKKQYGLATLCIGGGEASAVVLERC